VGGGGVAAGAHGCTALALVALVGAGGPSRAPMLQVAERAILLFREHFIGYGTKRAAVTGPTRIDRMVGDSAYDAAGGRDLCRPRGGLSTNNAGGGLPCGRAHGPGAVNASHHGLVSMDRSSFCERG
jgi:hypothetical protein